MSDRTARGLALAGSIGVPLAGGLLPAALVLADAGHATGLLVWLALWAPAAGWLAAPESGRALVVPAVWALALVGLAARSEISATGAGWAAAVLAGLFLGGQAVGRCAPGASRPGGAGVVLLLGALLCALPVRGGLSEHPWPPAAAARLLDVSPASLVVESAGVDWMRHAAVYGPAGTDRFQRAPYRGRTAGVGALVAGALLAAGASALSARSRGRETRSA